MTISPENESPDSTAEISSDLGICVKPRELPRVLIIGFGKMGRIHARHLTELGATWNFHDPFVPGGVGLERLNQYTHTIIATPISTHAEVYRRLDAFTGPILIEKPVVVRPEDLEVLDDPRVSAGMCERFNPAVQALKTRVQPEEIVSLEFCRTSLMGNVADVGIHDLDLFCHLLNLHEAPQFAWRGSQFVAQKDQIAGEFHWPVSPSNQRTLQIKTRNEVIDVDLLNQQINGSPLPFEWPVKRELGAFLKGARIDAKVAHQWLVQL